MVKENRILIFIIGFLCACVLFLNFSKSAKSESTISPGVSFSGASNVIYFLDRDNAKLYRYNIQGRLTRAYTIEELGEQLQLR